jgi:hypothetical protein
VARRTRTTVDPEHERQDVTESRPTTTTLQADLDSWLDAVEHGVARRVRVERLISAKGLLKPITLAQRFVIKSREIGIAPTARLVIGRLRAGAR